MSNMTLDVLDMKVLFETIEEVRNLFFQQFLLNMHDQLMDLYLQVKETVRAYAFNGLKKKIRDYMTAKGLNDTKDIPAQTFFNMIKDLEIECVKANYKVKAPTESGWFGVESDESLKKFAIGQKAWYDNNFRVITSTIDVELPEVKVRKRPVNQIDTLHLFDDVD